VTLTATVFADLAGAGPLAGCQGCDGTWDAADEARAAALGLSLPPFQLSVYDAGGRDLFEQRFDAAGRAVAEFTTGPLCGELPMRVQVLGGPDGWVACPASGGLTRGLTAAGETHVAFPLFPAAGCPVPPATDTPMAVTEPAPTASAAPLAPPTPGETATAPATVNPGPAEPARWEDRS
jgi:hypothetical protein